MLRARLYVVLVALALGCGGGPRSAPVAPARGDASARLAALADELWQAYLRNSPLSATSLGIPGYDDRLPDASVAAVEARRAEAASYLARAEAIDADALGEGERMTHAVIVHQLRGQVAAEACRTELWQVDHLWGPQVWLLDLGSQTRVRDERGERDFVARLAAFGGYMDDSIAGLRAGLAQGLVAPRLNVERSVRQLEELAQVAAADSALVAVADGVPEPRRAAFRAAIVAVVEGTVAPAFERYRRFLVDELLPAARDDVGLSALALGPACYRARIRRYTSRDDSAQALHELGLREMARIRGEMEQLAARTFPGVPLAEVLATLRDDPTYGFATRDEVEQAAVAAVDRARAKLPEAFSLLPTAQVVVQRMEAHAEKDSPMAYYRHGTRDGARPGVYLVNTYEPRTRPRYTAEVLAFHEALPGHHLQGAIAMELEGVPELQKHAGATAFVEGWALYTERLCDELGLYSGELDRLGMLSFDAWRAARLVVDTGIHALGWTRQQAIDYMLANTASTLPDIENEVDRYITWPGQALAYKVGQLEILRLRERAQTALGDRFDLREFHRRVLRHGAVPLSALADEIERWIAGG